MQNKNIASEADDVIQDAYWMLVSLEGESIQTPADTRTAYIRFEENETDVNGYAGCNKFFGKYALNGDSLQLSDLSTSRMSCPAMQTENKLMEVLRRANTYRISGNVLTLFAEGKAVATFMTGNPELMESQLGQ
jgi:heat shock protein HslJ